MSGHSKWATIKRSKAATDAKRGKAFTKVTREIIAAAKQGGGNPDLNARLRTAILAAKAVNMPSDNIKKAIMKGTGELKADETLDDVMYEGYGPGGVAIMVEATTENKNRTASEVRSLFTKHGGNMGEPGSVGWMFDKKGLLTVKRSAISEEDLMTLALDAGAEDIQTDDPEVFTVVTAPNAFEQVLQAVKSKTEPESAEISIVPKNYTAVEGKSAEQLLKLMDALDDLDDVQKVHANFDMDDALMEKLRGAG
jgi:YebC/PmpR family DNA-binding regulatory protein